MLNVLQFLEQFFFSFENIFLRQILEFVDLSQLLGNPTSICPFNSSETNSSLASSNWTGGFLPSFIEFLDFFARRMYLCLLSPRASKMIQTSCVHSSTTLLACLYYATQTEHLSGTCDTSTLSKRSFPSRNGSTTLCVRLPPILSNSHRSHSLFGGNNMA